MTFIKSLSGATVLSLMAPLAHAGSFAINENSAADMGRANSGRITQIGDASAAFGNPALMTQFSDFTLTSVASYISGETLLVDEGSVDLLGNPLGPQPSDAFDDTPVPALHAIYPVSEKVALGLSVNATYGLSSTYSDTSLVRYQALGSALTTINVNPSIALELSDQLSIGGGVSVQYAHTELSSAIDFGAVCFAGLGPMTCGSLGLLPQSADGKLELEGDDISFGYNLGLAFKPSQNLTLGTTYRSGVEHRLSGEAEIDVPTQAAPLLASGAFVDTDFEAELPLPGTIEIGLEWRASDKVMISTNYISTDWSQLQQLEVDFENPAQPPTGEDLRYTDSGRYAVGLDWKANSNWTLRTGYAYDESPSQDGFNTARIPDNDRNIYAIGATYNGWDFAQIDLAYNYFDFKDTAFDQTGEVNDRIRGTVTTSVNIFAASLTKRF